MANEKIPYLCGGTFLTQVLRARPDLSTATEHTNGQKENLSEQETFRRLISIYQLSDFPSCTSLKTYTSKYKKCTDSLVSFGQFADNDLHRAFDEAIKSSNSAALQMTVEFVREFISDGKQLQLVRGLLDMIEHDPEILTEDEFYITCANPIKKKDIFEIDHFFIEPFLLGVWHYIIMNRSDDNKKGAATYRQWYPQNKVYRGTVGNAITRDITVEKLPLITSDHEGNMDNSFSDGDPQVEMTDSDEETQGASEGYNQYIENATIVNQHGENNIQIAHVDVLNL
ncbi:hypothetical protein Q5O14_08370 [Eubacteriaceae bacterium ES2]|nr:hypothetical protein Q5O14_08370 [Eubacteriaceae bacterium ES2]